MRSDVMRGRGRLFLLALAGSSIGACGSNLLTFDVELQSEVYKSDFGNATGTLPDIPCSSTGDSACNQLPVVGVDTSSAAGAPSSATIAIACDTTAGRCYVEANARVAEPIDVQLDPGFSGKAEGRLIGFVRSVDLMYRVSSNTLTFAVPHIDIFVGPGGVSRETDPGVVPCGSTPPLEAGATLDNGHLPIDDGSPAHGLIESAIRNKQAFTFVLVLSPQIRSGSPVPAGTIEVDVTPKLTIGI